MSRSSSSPHARLVGRLGLAALAAVASLSSAGCIAQLVYCNTDLECGNGESCELGLCGPSREDRPGLRTPDAPIDDAPIDDAPIDDPPIDDATPPLPTDDPCRAIVETFDGDDLEAGGWQTAALGAASVNEAEGALHVRALATAAIAIGEAQTQNLRVRGRSIAFALAAHPDDPAAFGYVSLWNPSAPNFDELVFVVITADQFLAVVQRAEGQIFRQADFDPVLHRWMRFREADGRMFFDTSADGVNFAPFFDELAPDLPDGSILSLGIQAEGTSSSAAAAFDAVVSPPLASCTP